MSRKPMPGAMPAELAERLSDTVTGPSDAELRELAREMAQDEDWLHDELGSDLSGPVLDILNWMDCDPIAAIDKLRAALIERAYKELTK